MPMVVRWIAMAMEAIRACGSEVFAVGDVEPDGLVATSVPIADSLAEEWWEFRVIWVLQPGQWLIINDIAAELFCHEAVIVDRDF